MDRTKAIGGSDVAAIMGVSPFKTKVDLYLEKIGALTETNSPQKQKVLDRGNRAEKYILEEYEDVNSVKVLRSHKSIAHPQYPFLIGNVDGYYKDDNTGKIIVVEAKSSNMFADNWGGKVPEHYITQAAFYAILTDCVRVDFAVMFSGWVYKQFTYERDLEFEKRILDECVSFWNSNVLAKLCPEPSCVEDIRKIYNISEATKIIANDKMNSHLVKIKELTKTIESAEKEIKDLKFQIASEMKEKDHLVDQDDNILATWKTQQTRRFDFDSFKDLHKDLCLEFYKVYSNRVFRVK